MNNDCPLIWQTHWNVEETTGVCARLGDEYTRVVTEERWGPFRWGQTETVAPTKVVAMHRAMRKQTRVKITTALILFAAGMLAGAIIEMVT